MLIRFEAGMSLTRHDFQMMDMVDLERGAAGHGRLVKGVGQDGGHPTVWLLGSLSVNTTIFGLFGIR